MPAPQRDAAETRQRLLDWLPTRLPGARDLEVSPLAGPEATGFSNDTLLCDVSWREDGRRRSEGVAVRLMPSGLPVFPEYDLARQYHVMRILADTDVPVPRTLWLEEDPAPLGSPFYVMERVAGEIPEDNPPYHTAGWLTRLDPARRATLWWSGLEALCHVHRLDWRDLGLDFLASCEPGDTPLARHLAYYARYLEWLGLRGRHPTLDAALAWLEAEQPDEAPSAAVCWGDARIGNMIFRDARCVAVLDWEMARLGDPVEDLAWWIVLDRHHSEGCDVPRLPGLPKREATVARWQERTGREPRHLAYHEVFAAFRFAAIIARVGQQLRAYGFLPPDATFEIDNTASRLLARMGDFPPPSA